MTLSLDANNINDPPLHSLLEVIILKHLPQNIKRNIKTISLEEKRLTGVPNWGSFDIYTSSIDPFHLNGASQKVRTGSFWIKGIIPAVKGDSSSISLDALK